MDSVKKADEKMMAVTSQNVFVLVANDDFAEAKQVAEAVYGELKDSRNFESLINNYELKVEYSSDSSYIGNLIIFSKLCIDERKIVIYIESLQEIYLFLYKFLFIQIDINDFFSIAKYHELCHYIDLTILDSQIVFFEKYIEITVCIFLKKYFNLSFYPWLLDLSYLYERYFCK
ncbi:hypothetical protein IJJ97_07325 [bacterium]|nr:hypothetical protein [bacterium]